MDPEFDKIYAQQVGVFRAMQTLERVQFARPRPEAVVRDQAMHVVDEAIEIALKELGPNFDVRADAKLFLMVNLTQVVAIPLLSRGPNAPFGDIRGTLINDAISIVRAASEHCDGEREISAASMLLGAAGVLQKLSLKQWRLWDRR